MKTKNADLSDARRRAREIVEDEGYFYGLMQRAKAGTLPPQVEVMLHHYAYGKPIQRVELSQNEHNDLSDMTNEQLLQEAEHLKQQLLILAHPETAH